MVADTTIAALIVGELRRSTTALTAALNRPATAVAALQNPILPTGLFAAHYMELVGKKVSEAKDVLGSTSPENISAALTLERRASVLTHLVRRRDLTNDQYHQMLSYPKFAKGTADAILEEQVGLSDDLWPVLGQLGFKARLSWLRYSGAACPDSVVADALRFYGSWGANSHQPVIADILADRPAVISAAARSDSDRVRTAAAGCRHLLEVSDQREVAELDGAEATSSDPAVLRAFVEQRMFLLIALACNPVCDLSVVEEIAPLLRKYADHDGARNGDDQLQRRPNRIRTAFEDVSDPDAIDWLLRRTFPHGTQRFDGPRKDRTRDLGALVANPHLSGRDIERIAGTVWAVDELNCAAVQSTDHLVVAPGDPLNGHVELRRTLRELVEHPNADGPLVQRLRESIDDAGPLVSYRDIVDGAPEAELDHRVSLTVREIEYAASARVCSMNARLVAGHLERELPDTLEAWASALDLAPSFENTAADLVTVVRALTANF